MNRLSLMGPARALAIAALCVVPLAVLPAGCKLFRKTPLQSTVQTRDPRTAAQLVDGFYGVEAAAWRWTAKQFSVKLKVPAGAAQKGATLRLMLSIPPAVIEQSTTVTLSAALAGTSIAPETYSAPGQFTYQRDVAAGLLAASDVTVNFQLDKAITPGGLDKRELGLVVTTISLETK
jgi:hypothetical protein